MTEAAEHTWHAEKTRVEVLLRMTTSWWHHHFFSFVCCHTEMNRSPPPQKDLERSPGACHWGTETFIVEEKIETAHGLSAFLINSFALRYSLFFAFSSS
jgi:hypothetical protein